MKKRAPVFGMAIVVLGVVLGVAISALQGAGKIARSYEGNGYSVA